MSSRQCDLFMRRDEVEAAWRWIDPIREAWTQMNEPPRPCSRAPGAGRRALSSVMDAAGAKKRFDGFGAEDPAPPDWQYEAEDGSAAIADVTPTFAGVASPRARLISPVSGNA
jgi:hypothetical protein